VETHEKLAIYAGSHARGNLPFIHLCNEWSCTPEIRVKTYIFKPGYYEKVWERVAMHKKVWDPLSYAFPPHYILCISILHLETESEV